MVLQENAPLPGTRLNSGMLHESSYFRESTVGINGISLLHKIDCEYIPLPLVN